MKARISSIEFVLPEKILSNEDLVCEYSDWTVGKISEKTGVYKRHVVDEEECASDLAVRAAKKLFQSGTCTPDQVDYLLYCTQSPDYFLPATACVLQNRLKIPTHAGAIDFNQGCSGYVYGLGLAKALIETNQAQTVLFVTAETYSKFIHPGDRSVRTLFGDAAAATLIRADNLDHDVIGPFVYGTDGSGAKNLIVPSGGARCPISKATGVVEEDEHGNLRSDQNLYMNGSEIFTFTLKTVPGLVNALLEKSSNSLNDIDLFVFHQANKFMLDHLRKRIKIPEEKFAQAFKNFGNTVSSTVPITLKEMENAGRLKPGMKVMLVAFGVGYSWGANLIEW